MLYGLEALRGRARANKADEYVKQHKYSEAPRAAVSGVSVSFSSQPSGQSALSGTSANDGSVTFTGLAVGNYTLQVSKRSYVSGSAKGVVKAGSQTELTSTLQAQPSGGIPGFPIVSINVGVLLSVALLWFNECRTRLRDV